MEGVIEPVLLLERALAAYGTRAGWAFGPVHVQLWIDRLGNTSAVYGFRVLSADETVPHAEGRRVQVRLDPSTLRPAVIGPELRAACRPLERAAASVGLDASTG